MALIPFDLAQALIAMGPAEVFIGDPTVSSVYYEDAFRAIGAIEGPISVSVPNNQVHLVAPEQTGQIPHQIHVTLGEVRVTASVILGDPQAWKQFSPTKTPASGFKKPQHVFTTTVLVIPRSEVGGGLERRPAPDNWERKPGFGFEGAIGEDAAPKNAIWLWRAVITRGEVSLSYNGGGKVPVQLTFTAFQDFSKPPGHQVYTIGDPTRIVPAIPILPGINPLILVEPEALHWPNEPTWPVTPIMVFGSQPAFTIDNTDNQSPRWRALRGIDGGHAELFVLRSATPGVFLLEVSNDFSGARGFPYVNVYNDDGSLAEYEFVSSYNYTEAGQHAAVLIEANRDYFIECWQGNLNQITDCILTVGGQEPPS